MPKQRIKLIVNPNADTGRAWRLASDLRPITDEFGGASWSGTVYPGHAQEMAHQAAEEGCELVIAAGGFLVALGARNDDGILEYAGVRRISRPMMLCLLPEVMRGTHARFRQVRMGSIRRLELESNQPLTIHTDGEIFAGFGMDVRRLTLDLLPGGVQVVY